MFHQKERKKSSLKFVNLHSHSTFSTFDAIGYPDQHMEYAYQNGMDALALTDHGNMNGLGYQVMHAKKMQKEGKEFKPIFGIESYFLPSIVDWRKEAEQIKEYKKSIEKNEEESAVIIEDEKDLKKEERNILNKRHHLTLLAMNQEGLNNLFKLVSTSYTKEYFYRYPRIDYDLLEKYNKGIIVLSSCIGGNFAKHVWKHREDGENKIYLSMNEDILRFMDIFKDRFYGELQWNNIPEQHILNKMIIQYAKEKDFKLLSTVDTHYVEPEHWRDREVYKRLGYLGKSNKPDWFSEKLPENINEIGFELFQKNGDQVWESYLKYSKETKNEYNDNLIKESIENTYNLAFDKIEKFYPDNAIRLPNFVVPKGEQEDHYLAKLSIQELKEKKLDKEKKYIDRLKEELYVVQSRGFSKYFLTMKAISDKAQESQLTSPSRGSSSGSLIAYLLNITQIDPIKFNLQFSRFLMKDQKGMPDVDFDTEEPMELKEQLIKEWGQNKVVPISNFNTLQLRSLIKNISKLYNIPFEEVNNVTGKMLKEATPVAKKQHGITAGIYVPTFEETVKYSETLQKFLEKYPIVKEHIEILHGQISSCSRHAGGICVGEDLDKWMPLISSGGIIQSPWTEGQTVRHLEPMGFIKYDLLGLASLRMIRSCIEHILKRYFNILNPNFQEVKKFYNEKLHPEIIDFNNQEVYENIFHDGKFLSIFQFTEIGMQNFCKQAKPKNLTDLSAVTSIYRPSALSASVDKKYLTAKENPSEIKYYCKEYKEVTQESFGNLIFQEQIAELAHKLGKNISLDEGNYLRKLLVKKGTGNNSEEIEKIHNKFLEGCKEKNISLNIANKIFQEFEYFSGYGFCKSLYFSELVTIYNKDGKKIDNKKIKDIKSGDYVRTREEKTKNDIFVKVINNHYHGKLKIFKVLLDNGKEVRCTINHKFRTKEGKMLPLWRVLIENLDIVVNAEKY